MNNRRVLHVHCSKGHLGDAIRISKVNSFLEKRGFKVHEKWINTEKLRALVSALAGLRHVVLDHRDKKIRTRSPMEALASLFFNSIQHEIMREAMTVRPCVIVAETLLAGYFSLMSKTNMGVPLVTDVHGLVGEESKLKRSRYAGILSEVEEITLHNSDYLLAVSQQMKRQLCLTREAQADKIVVVPNGGDSHYFHAHFSFPLNVIYAGNFAVYERVPHYLEIAKALEDAAHFAFYLMGDGVQKKEILSRVKREKIPITFIGLKARQDALRILSEMQVGVVTSTSGIEREVAFPLKVLDYLSCGLPVIAPKIGDWGKMIEEQNCGVALEANSVARFIEALYSLCDEKEWMEKSANGKECIEKKYRWDLVLEPLGALIENMAG